MTQLRHGLVLSLIITLAGQSAIAATFASDQSAEGQLVSSGKVALPVATAPANAATACKSQDDWNEPTPARHIYGNTWYVGTCGISVILIASPKGHVLIDSAPAKSFASIERNLLSLGVKLQQIKTLLITHEHHDHAGGIAQLQQASGAQVLVREAGLKAIQSGLAQAGDPQQFSLDAMQPVANVKRIQDGASLSLAGKQIKNIPMPGHTLGGSGWSWRECQNGRCKTLVFADSLGAVSDPDYRYFSAHGLAAALRQSAQRLEKLDCDILISGHTGASKILDRLDGKMPLINPLACKEYARIGLQNLSKREQKEQPSQ